MKTIENIVYIPVKNIAPHKDNPRKDMGDLTELAESIKLHGILQNLTVVPRSDADADLYTAVIGHRRLAAAVLAGLDAVPCVIRDMSEADQIRTMLLENISRVDLTPYEQAQGFQMMLDLGDSVDDISERTGFSASTVRRRVKLLELDQDKFIKATERGATLFDLAQLEELEDPALKNEVLDFIGTNNFKNKLQSAIDKENRLKKIASWAEQVSSWAEKIESSDNEVMSYFRSYYAWSGEPTIERPSDADTVKYWYTTDDNRLAIYRDKTADSEDEDTDAEERERRRLALEEQERKIKELTAMAERHFDLRKAFVTGYGKAKSAQKKIMAFAGGIIFDAVMDYMNQDFAETIVDMLDLDVDIENDDDAAAIKDALDQALGESPERTLLLTAYAATDNDSEKYFAISWPGGNKEIVYRPNDDLDRLYAFLCSLGYEMSDEEKQMQNGDHPYLSTSNAKC